MQGSGGPVVYISLRSGRCFDNQDELPRDSEPIATDKMARKVVESVKKILTWKRAKKTFHGMLEVRYGAY